MTNITKSELKKIFESPIDGASSNAYRHLLRELENTINKHSTETHTAMINSHDMLEAINKASIKWEKKIDEYLS